METKRLLIVAHAPSTNTGLLLDAVLTGPRFSDVTGVDVFHISPLETSPEDVLKAQAVVWGATENLGYMSGALKDFFDRIYYLCLEKNQGLSYALYIRAG